MHNHPSSQHHTTFKNRERTSLRARIRSLESELESMKIMRAGMENENQKMRRLISVYIQSSDLNDPAWEVMDEDDMGGK